MSKESSAQSLGEIINAKKFIIPMYQRNYKWNKDVAKKLAADIISNYKNNKTPKSLGLLTLHEKDGKYYVIDGQQRFTTLCILLSLLDSYKLIDLEFERDDQNDKRIKAIRGELLTEWKCTDVNRIERNRKVMEGEIARIDANQKNDLANFILEKVILLCSIVKDAPVDEFMNLNAYKTAFSISDHIRANIISLNSFYKDKMSESKYESILSYNLSNYSYKTAVAILYNDIQKKMYKDVLNEKGKYNNIYKLLLTKSMIDPEWKQENKKERKPEIESRINILFSDMPEIKGKNNYTSGEIIREFDDWIKILQKLSYVNKILCELEDEIDPKTEENCGKRDFHSFKQIDDYQKMTKNSFILKVFDGDSALEADCDPRTLAREIQKYCNIDSVLVRYLNEENKKLTNRYLEAFAYPSLNEATNNKADILNIELPQMSETEVIEEIIGSGRYIVDRYEMEHRDDLNVIVSIPPVMDLEDRENVNLGGMLDDSEIISVDEITAGKLFDHDIVIPVIQRDYCMGARISGNNDFLKFLLNGFKNNTQLKASTILISVTNDDDKKIYIFDGQQRTFTLFNILKYCEKDEGIKALKSYTFVGRTDKNNNDFDGCGSPYSLQARENLVKNLEEKLGELKVNPGMFAKYIKENVYFKVKVVNDVSGAEQFFMDINGGVALEPYEIFKAMLCDRLSELGRSDVVILIENDWLDFFYKYRETQVGSIADDESDEEELLEIRFIEYVCRFVYKENHNEDTKIFDEIESKSEIVAELGYVKKLDRNDIENICTIIGNIITSTDIADTNNNSQVKGEYKRFAKNSSGEELKIYHLMLDKINKSVILNDNYYIKRFIWSLSNTGRETLKKYYKYKYITSLKKIYDEDEILRDVLLNTWKSEQVNKLSFYHYSQKKADFHIYFYGGYNNRNIDVTNITVKEIPAYYYSKISFITGVDILRVHYLYEKAEKDCQNTNNEKNALYFAFIKDNAAIKYENENSSDVIQIKSEIEYSIYYSPIYSKEIWNIKFKKENKWINRDLTQNKDAFYFKNKGSIEFIKTVCRK